MKLHFLAGICLVLMLMGCGEGASGVPPSTSTGGSPDGGSDAGGPQGGDGGQGVSGSTADAGTGGFGGNGGQPQGGSGGHEGGAGGSGGLGGCSPGNKQCDGLDAQVCDEDREWATISTCPYVCSGGSCAGVCVPTSKQCDNLTPQTCNAQGQWEDGEVCSFVCFEGDCVGSCVPDETSCTDDDVYTCSDLGEPEYTETCLYVCLNGACTGVCAPNAKKCDGTGYQVCSAQGQWGSTTPCPVEAHQNPTCSGDGICGTVCQNGWEDCTGAPGCETDLTDPDTCGSCVNDCNETNGTATCSNGTCGIICNGGWDDCNGQPGCETPLGTLTNCLSCGDVCPSAPSNAYEVCNPSGCDFECNLTWGNCDGNDGNGCEHDVWNDAFNCGTCDGFCYGGTCSTGTCSQELEVVAESPALIDAFTIDSNKVYWSTNETPANIYSAPKSGGSPTLIGTDPNRVRVMVSDGTDLVFADWTAPAIKVIPVGGGSVTTLASGYFTYNPKIDLGYAYWNDSADYGPCNCSTPTPLHIYRTLLSGGPIELVATVPLGGTPALDIRDDVADLVAIEFVSHGPYVSGTGHFGGIGWARKSVLNQTRNISVNDVFYSGQTQSFRQMGDLVRNGTYTFFYAALNLTYSAIVRYNYNGNVKEVILDDEVVSYANKLTVDESNLYWRELGGTGTKVYRLSVNGGPYTTIATGQLVQTDNVELDATHVYWAVRGFRTPGSPPTDTLTQAIMRMAK